MTFDDAKELEREVRRLAEALWGGRPGAAQARMINGRERDCIFEAEDLTHYIECTISKSSKKIEIDGRKMTPFRDSEAKKGKTVKLWIVTREDPIAEQVTEARKHGITILSLHSFRSRLLDGDSYVNCRRKYRWGSATDPANDSDDISSLHYQYTSLHDIHENVPVTLLDVQNCLESGSAVTILGDYGMGKSMLVREVFLTFAKRYQKDSAPTKVPVAINLRDHWGQSDPHEVLTRHAKKIGFDQPTQLIRAYNAGNILLLVDGFDEIVGTPVASRRELKRLRRESLSVVRHFVQDLRGKAGLMVAGRQNFFDSDQERQDALDMRPSDPVFELGEFSASEAEQLLQKFKVKGEIPIWLPKRPLFLAYLASHGLLAEITSDGQISAAEAWERLIGAICVREKRINEHLDAGAIQNILEVLADITRETSVGRGPLYPSDIFRAYKLVTQYDEPDEHIRPLLMRLPGLSSRSSEDGSREFLDDSMLNALRASRLDSYVRSPYEVDPIARKWRHGASELGLDIAANRLKAASVVAPKVMVAARQAIERWDSPTLAADMIRLGQRLLENESDLECDCEVSKGVFEELDLSESTCSRLWLTECDIRSLVMPVESPVDLSIRDCLIDRVLGVSKPEQIPDWIQNCEIGAYATAPTNALILQDVVLPVPHRVLLTILRKLYVQKGSCRQENALSRGLPSGYREYVSPILEVMKSKGFVAQQVLRGSRVWYPDRSRTAEVHGILNDYAGSSHGLVLEVRGIQH